MNIYNPPTASQVIGLGTAAVKNTGVSGDAVPVLNGAATTWGAGATFAGTVTMTGVVLNPGDIPSMNFSGNLTRYASPDGLYRFYLGNATDPRNILTNTSTEIYTAALGALIATFDSTGLDVVGLSRCDSFRIDQAATVETIASDRTITINANGTEIRLLAAAGA